MGEVITFAAERRQSLSRLLVLPFAPDDIDEWLRALVDVPDDVLDAAVSYAIKTRAHFPLPAELRADADDVLASTRARSVPSTRTWQDDCHACDDTGWLEWWCGEPADNRREIATKPCGRTFPHDPHLFVSACPCRATNPTYQRHRAAQVRYADDRERSRRR